MGVIIEPADFSSDAFAALVERHTAFCDGTAPAESCHRLPLDALMHPALTVWQAIHEGQLVGMGALREMPGNAGEIKSMHTVQEARGIGVAQQILSTIITAATARGYHALWLETGVHPDFDAARRLYGARGFVETEPFGDYTHDPHSVFLTLPLIPKGAAE